MSIVITYFFQDIVDIHNYACSLSDNVRLHENYPEVKPIVCILLRVFCVTMISRRARNG